jgi:hypothetical protein
VIIGIGDKDVSCAVYRYATRKVELAILSALLTLKEIHRLTRNVAGRSIAQQCPFACG